MNTPSLTAIALKILLFGADDLEDKPYLSKSPGDTAKVLKRPFSIGQTIKDNDPNEDILHVEVVTNQENQQWCEIWLVSEWKESNTRRQRIQSRSAEERTAKTIRDKRFSEIKEHLLISGFQNRPDFAAHLAEQILSNWKDGKNKELFNVLKLAEKLNEYEEEDKQPESNKT